MEQVNAKCVAIFAVSACLIGMVVGSAVTLAVLTVQRVIPVGHGCSGYRWIPFDAARTLNLRSISRGEKADYISAIALSSRY